MGLDELHLRVLSASSDDPTERKNAQKGMVVSCVLFKRGSCLPSPQTPQSRSPLGSRRKLQSALLPRELVLNTSSGPPFRERRMCLYSPEPVGDLIYTSPDCKRKSTDFSGQCSTLCALLIPADCSHDNPKLGGGLAAVAISTTMIGLCLYCCFPSTECLHSPGLSYFRVCSPNDGPQ